MKRFSPMVLVLLLAGAASALELKSPEGKIALSFELKGIGTERLCPIYTVAYRGRTVLADSRLGLQLADGRLDEGLEIIRELRTQIGTTWVPVCGERSTIRDHYNQVDIDLRQMQTGRRLRLTFRAYDEGVAFCYTLPSQDGLKEFTINVEDTQFSFTGDHAAWAVYAAQGNYDPADVRPNQKPVEDSGEVPLSRIRAGAERPLTVRIADDLYAAITEARLVDYARMKLRRAKERASTLEAFLDAERGRYGTVSGVTPFTSPWRVIMLAESPGKLLEQNYIILNLNEPCALKDTAWIKPGKVIREATLTTAGGKACVDFCVQRGLQYIEYDAGWYGRESDTKSDARDVHLDPQRNPNPSSLNLREVIDYANANGIGVILYVNHLALEKQIDEILPLYEKWGVKGVKFGFVNVGSQRWTSWLHEAIRKAAEHHLMVDIHDEFRSTGYQRTYPNLMTVEGIRGNEEFPSAVHNATLPFTRFLTGPADYTFCWYSNRLKVTHAHQLAISTIFYSPWQFLYWYDRPAQYRGEKALEYWRDLPTTWDDTRVLHDKIGKTVSVARRKGNNWYVGTINPAGARLVEIPVAFLERGKRYDATIYSDLHPDDTTSKDVNVEAQAVDSTTVIKANISGNGGHAMRIVPQ